MNVSSYLFTMGLIQALHVATLYMLVVVFLRHRMFAVHYILFHTIIIDHPSSSVNSILC